ncbi:FAD-dependent oxidoreductase [Slackia exigua]|uniref:Tat pathway signal sequence domain protein n=1 Tax=Slackia exigua (strain ATCC 700122 / DSM 15923 / CIP 105133 / JCM 11022 / KCTC 5966 / S-7) TaxID=649764 RepID=D0WFP8_SLAES|nr:FAD-dependent oxidoreductase [Slackia exigua]EEZ61311.1 Tat pathway signal sequence domain protein [Slackia exigua ATCC 700122]STN98959.1 Fumarate reductase flavoprotein subunit precursor [Slackia exigua]
MDKGISRRSFLTGGSAIGALAAFGITGCASEVGSESRSAADEADWKQSLNVDIASTLPGNTDESVDVSKTVECDVAVIGAGCSGINAAVRAAQEGLSVVLIEKTDTIGGASLDSWAPSAYNSSYAQEAGVVTDTDPIIEAWVADCHWRVDASAVRQLVNTSGEAVDWMRENGWDFKYVGMGSDITALPDYDTREPLFREMLRDSVEQNGEVITGTAAKHLVIDSSGAVIGVVAVDGSDEGIQVNARAVVIATGGYGANAPMVKNAFGFKGVFAGLPQNIGEGLEMAWAVGAQKPQNFGGQMLHQTLARATSKLVSEFDAFPAKYPMILTYVANLLNVGSTGRRFRNESLVLNAVPSANSSAYQGSFHYVIVSRGIMDALEKGGLAELGVDYTPGLPPEYRPEYALDTPWKGITDVFDRMVANGDGYKGDTPEELAQSARMDVDVFAGQLAQYDEACASGIDAQFGKAQKYLNALGSGPYYAVIAEENNLCSWGGLLTDADYQVLDGDRLPIRGLYAVGNEAGGNLYNDTYVGFGYGMGNAITSGYICGSKLATSMGR